MSFVESSEVLLRWWVTLHMRHAFNCPAKGVETCILTNCHHVGQHSRRMHNCKRHSQRWWCHRAASKAACAWCWELSIQGRWLRYILLSAQQQKCHRVLPCRHLCKELSKISAQEADHIKLCARWFSLLHMCTGVHCICSIRNYTVIHSEYRESERVTNLLSVC